MNALAVAACHGIAWLGVTSYALYNVWLAVQAWRASRRTTARPPPPDAWPSVTVQLPIYNEPCVDTLLHAVAALDYPHDKLDVQVLDDSDDIFAKHTAEVVRTLRATGLSITHHRRAQRAGYKAGALAQGLCTARGALLLLLDADFTPDADLLQRLVPWFSDPHVGMVQARWGHTQDDDTPLTRCAKYWIDRHFYVDQLARSRFGQFFHFNGSAGMWRRSAVDDAGGWRSDTLTEDMDLSFRAWQLGWHFVYDHDVVVQAQVPPDAVALRIQQRRWACGTFQVARRALPRLAAAGNVEHTVGSFFHLTGYGFPMLLCFLALLTGAGVAAKHTLLARVCIELPAAIFFGYMTLRTAGCWVSGGWRVARLELEAAAMGMGLTPTLVAGACAAFAGRPQVFQRTPKVAERHGAAGQLHIACIEVVLAVACATNVIVAVAHRQWFVALLPMLAAWGLAVMGISTIAQRISASVQPSVVGAKARI